MLEKLNAQGQTLKNSFAPYLNSGLPLNQFPGFLPLSTPIMASDSSIEEIAVVNTNGEVIFSNRRQGEVSQRGEMATGPFIRRLVPGPAALWSSSQRFSMGEDEHTYWVKLPLRNRFEIIGHLILSTPKQKVSDVLLKNFRPGVNGLMILVGLFFLFLIIAEPFWGNQEKRWLQLSYGIVFLAVAGLVVLTLIATYSEGIHGRTQSLSQSLAARFNNMLELGIDLADISGLQDMIEEYQRFNPDISYVALTSGGRIKFHSDPEAVGRIWTPLRNHVEYELVLRRAARDVDGPVIAIKLGIPENIIYARLWRNVKNFFVLFIAAGFFSFFLLDVLLSIRGRRDTDQGSEDEIREFRVDQARPVFFLGVFIEGLHISFLPQYFQRAAQASGVDPSWASTPFTLYFAAFALTLLPAGKFAGRWGVKVTMLAGIGFSASAFGALSVVEDFYGIGLLRVLAGIGQGMIFIGCASYIAITVSSAKRTQGAAIIVFGFFSGFISGSAMGALLVSYIGPTGVFMVAGILGGLIFLYALLLIGMVPSLKFPAVAPAGGGTTKDSTAKGGLTASLGRLLRDLHFCKTSLCIGINIKAVFTGVTLFAMPVLMAAAGYAQEDIGQIQMFYFGGVLLSNHYIARITDRTGRSREILILGAIGSSFSLILIGTSGWEGSTATGIPLLTTVILIGGMSLLGIAHGFIFAPILIHIAGTPAAGILGPASAISYYRVLERVGHIAGPIIAAQLLIRYVNSPLIVSWIGAATLLLVLVYVLPPGGKSATPN